MTKTIRYVPSVYSTHCHVGRRYNRISRGIGTGCASAHRRWGKKESLLSCTRGAYNSNNMQYYILTLDTRRPDPLSSETPPSSVTARIGPGLFPGPVSWAQYIIIIILHYNMRPA